MDLQAQALQRHAHLDADIRQYRSAVRYAADAATRTSSTAVDEWLTLAREETASSSGGAQPSCASDVQDMSRNAADAPSAGVAECTAPAVAEAKIGTSELRLQLFEIEAVAAAGSSMAVESLAASAGAAAADQGSLCAEHLDQVCCLLAGAFQGAHDVYMLSFAPLGRAVASFSARSG